MRTKESPSNLKTRLSPSKNQNLAIVELIVEAFLVYYDFLFKFSASDFVPTVLIVLLIVYAGFAVAFYAVESKKIVQDSFQGRFYLYNQTVLSCFLGITFCAVYLASKSLEVIIYFICAIPLAFLVLIVVFHEISQFTVKKFLKWVVKDQIWNKLEEQTKKDFKHAEASIRADNISNAVINACKCIERELKVTIFDPFKEEVKGKGKQVDHFEVLEPFESEDGEDPRQRTYMNFRNYLEDKRHLTLGNIPFFLLNLTDNKIGKNTVLFSKFADFLKQRFKEKYSNVLEISRILFKHDYFSVFGIKISDLRNEAAHPQRESLENEVILTKSDRILSIDNYVELLKVIAVKPNLFKLITDLKE